MSKEENGAPTFSIEAVLLSCVIYAMEKRESCVLLIAWSFHAGGDE